MIRMRSVWQLELHVRKKFIRRSLWQVWGRKVQSSES